VRSGWRHDDEPGPAKDIVLVDIADGVITITLNRPGVRNAINEAMATAIGSALDSVLPSPASPCTHIIALAATTSARLSGSTSRASVATTFAPASPR
jgi:1,4-dihydroxy-2-naphthoyl-CoA synthase